MIDVKDAAKLAAKYFTDLYADQSYSEVLFEEFDYDTDNNLWLVTLGYYAPITQPPIMAAMQRAERKYKVFEIDAETGKVLSMKIRTVEHA